MLNLTLSCGLARFTRPWLAILREAVGWTDSAAIE
jgi:hypothetical protein